MLQSIRDLSRSWLIKGLLLVLIGSFAVWGIGDIFRGQPQNRPVISVGDTSITLAQFEQQVRTQQARLRQQFGALLRPEDLAGIDVVGMVTQRSIETALFDQAVAASGLQAGRRAVAEEMSRIPELRDDNGNFSADRYAQLLQNLGQSEAAFIASQQTHIARQILGSALVAPIQVSDLLTRTYQAASTQQRALDLVLVDAPRLPRPAAPSPDVLRQFRDQHATRYQTPEYRSGQLLVIDSASLAAAAAPSPADLEAAFAERRDALGTPERRSFRQATFVSSEQLAKFRAALTAGTDFATAAIQFANMPATPLSEVAASDLPDELRAIAFAPGDWTISEPANTPLGWQILERTATTAAQPAEFAKVRDQLARDLVQERVGHEMERLIRDLDDQLLSGAALDEAAATLGLKIQPIPTITATGTQADGKPVSLPHVETVQQALFNLASGENSGVIELPNGDALVVAVTAIEPARLQEVTAIADRLRADWQRAEQQTATLALAEKLAGQWRSGTALTALRDGNPAISTESTPPRDRRTQQEALADVPPAFLDRLYQEPVGTIIWEPTMAGAVLGRVRSAITAPDSADDAKRQELKAELNQNITESILESINAALREQYPPKLDTQALEQIRERLSSNATPG